MKEVVFRGVVWVGVTMVLGRAARYIVLLILAGLLKPEDFGLFAALYVVVDGLLILQGFGIGHALIFRKERTEEAFDTAFLLSIGMGTVLFVLAYLLAPVAATFYGESDLTDPLRFCCILLVLSGCRLVPFRMFEKALDFKKKLLPGVIGSAGHAGVALFLAHRGAGVWALVGGEVASLFLETSVYWILSPWRPKLRFRWSIAREDLGFGWAVLGGTVLMYLFRTVDRVVLSRFQGIHDLGLYAFAFAVASVPSTLIVRVLNTVLLPSYSSLGDNVAALRKLFFRATSYMAGAGAILVIGLVALGEYFLAAAYGEKWMGAVLPLMILSVFGFARAQFALVGDLLVGTGHPRTFRRLNLLQTSLAVAGIYPAVRFGGAPGVAIVMAAASILTLAAGWKEAFKILSAGPADLARGFRGPAVASVAAGGAAFVSVRLLPLPHSLAALLIAALIVTLIYATVWIGADRDLRNEWFRRRAAGKDSHPPGGE